MEMGLCPTAPPTAWADMDFTPILAAILRAMAPYVVRPP